MSECQNVRLFELLSLQRIKISRRQFKSFMICKWLGKSSSPRWRDEIYFYVQSFECLYPKHLFYQRPIIDNHVFISVKRISLVFLKNSSLSDYLDLLPVKSILYVILSPLENRRLEQQPLAKYFSIMGRRGTEWRGNFFKYWTSIMKSREVNISKSARHE